MKILMSVDQMTQVSSIDSISQPWEHAVNETLKNKDSDLLEFLDFKCP